MGAQLWQHKAPWRDDPLEALHLIQVRVLRENHDVEAELKRHVDGARESVGLCEIDDAYNLLDFYRGELNRLERLTRARISREPRQRIALLRKIYASSGEGIGSVLDVTGVSYRGGQHLARRLKVDEVRRLCGVARPNLKQARAAVDKINEQLQRGESVCFAFYAARGNRPTGWYFVGNTID